MNKYIYCSIIFFSIPAIIFSQETIRLTGPTIEDFGATFSVENPDFQTDTSITYRVIFDIHNTPEDHSTVNAQINTLARFLNMHAHAGVPLNRLKVAGVFHNKATHDVLNHEGYQAKYGVENPNLALIKALKKAGVELYICGQSISARGVNREQVDESVGVALSAMTVILNYHSKGYQLIKF